MSSAAPKNFTSVNFEILASPSCYRQVLLIISLVVSEKVVSDTCLPLIKHIIPEIKVSCLDIFLWVVSVVPRARSKLLPVVGVVGPSSGLESATDN